MREVIAGKRCLITGATGGLGRELAREFASSGAKLFLTARDTVRLTSLSKQPDLARATVTTAAVDLTLREGVGSLVSAVLDKFDSLDILVNCAGLFPVGEFAKIGVEEFDSCLALNLRAPFLLAQAFAPGMVERQWGRIVNIGSSSSYSGFGRTVAYCATKHGLLGFSRALHDELKEHGVRSICVAPGSIQTEMGRKVEGQDFETFLDPKEIARFVVDLTAIDGPMSADEVRLNRMVIR